MVFVFDLDDTLCDTDGYSKKYILNFFKQNNLPYKQACNNARFADGLFDWTHEEALSWYKIYGDEMMLNFPCKNNVVEVINYLYDNGHKIVIATARATDWHTNPEQITKLWLENNGIKYHKLYCGRFDKEYICEEVGADVFVDDDIKITSNVATYLEDKNIKAMLMTTRYNIDKQYSNKVVRINDLQDMLNVISEKDLNFNN